jgi:hypothetical protein
MNLLKKIEEALSGNTSRRGFLQGVLRASVSIAAVCAGLPSNALAIAPSCLRTGQFSQGGVGETCGGDSYCTAGASSWGCSLNLYRACTTADGCNGTTGSVSSSNCGGGMTSTGWWDCCCEGTKIRCRDCSSGGAVVCICRANIGSC